MLDDVAIEQRKPSMRRRLSMSTTVHPTTLDKLQALGIRFACSQGRVVDKAVDTLDRAFQSGKMLCCTGQPCQIGRTDLPTVL